MTTIDFTKVSANDDAAKNVHYRVLGYRNGVRRMSARMTYSEAKKAARSDTSLSIHSERSLFPNTKLQYDNS